jgi:hypothetical protein
MTIIMSTAVSRDSHLGKGIQSQLPAGRVASQGGLLRTYACDTARTFSDTHYGGRVLAAANQYTDTLRFRTIKLSDSSSFRPTCKGLDQPVAPIPERAISDHFNACLAFLLLAQFLDPPLFAFREPHVTNRLPPNDYKS